MRYSNPRFLLFALILITPLHYSLAGTSAACEKLLTPAERADQVAVEIDTRVGEQHGINRMVLRLRKNSLKKKVTETCAGLENCSSADVARTSEAAVLSAAKDVKRAKGYAILIGTMVASAALTTHLTAILPVSARFLTQLIGQISTVGIYVFGAPIWEPISSFFRKLAFGFGSTETVSKNVGEQSSSLETLWRETQSKYSLNAQMSRNVLNQFLIATHQNFYSAFTAIREQDPVTGRKYAIEQMAEAAVRMKTLFAEIPPDEESVARAVHASFTDHIGNPELFFEDVLKRIRELRPELENDEATQQYYQALLEAWRTAPQRHT